ncbi:hypothetical protein [Soonwooa sp.]|uniref:hypothetical protein n=1 Tax=Soonwooa sp. TaxID=1938592 RepID=UPI00262B56DA|nr:hypothetical protein [Soonwooa sp.]
MMKKLWILFFLYIIPISVFGQKNLESSLISSLLNYEKNKQNLDNSEQELTKARKLFTSDFEKAITSGAIENYNNFKQNVDTLNYEFATYISENKDIKLYRLSDSSMYNWSYLVKNNKIILKENEYHQYFTEVHNLSPAEFLIIKQMDEFVFSCNYASVYQLTSGKYILKSAFNKKKKLSICNFTHVETPTDHEEIPTRKIQFDASKKKIFFDDPNNKKTSAVYKNGNFNIADYDERTLFD